MGYLTLSRHLNQVIVINDSIFIKPTSFHGNSVRISIDAPDDITVDRLEIHQAKNKVPKDKKNYNAFLKGANKTNRDLNNNKE